MKKINSVIKKIENLTLTPAEITELIDSANITDELIDFIVNKYKYEIEKNDSLSHVRDVIELVDLTKYDEANIHVSEAAKRSFCSLMASGKLTRPEIIYFIKHDIATNDDIESIMAKFPMTDLVDVVLRWRPQLFESTLRKYCSQYGISSIMIENMKRRSLKIEKFQFLVN